MKAISNHPADALKQALTRLGDSANLPAAVKYLAANAKIISAELNDAILAEIPAFSESRNPDILPDLALHGPEHTNELIRLLRGGGVGDFEFVRAHARRRADQRFPLEAGLHAYRCGHKVFSRWVREAILAAGSSDKEAPQVIAAVADFTIEYTDAVSTVAASAYVEQTRLLADVAGDHRAELLNILLEGYDESDGRVAKILRDAGYLDSHQSFCVVLAQPVDPAEMQNPARARRLADAISKILHGSAARRLVDVRDNKVTSVFSDARRASGWTAPHTALARRLAEELSMLSNAVLVGVSNDVPSTSQIPNAYKEAVLALELADVSDRVVQFSGIPSRRLLMHLAGEEFQRALPAWAGKFIAADDKVGGVLVATLRAYADANMNVLKAAESLSVHPNTIYARMQRILDITELDARTYHALSELLIVAECAPRSSGGDGRK
jgi:sugar diacid utilization regulator